MRITLFLTAALGAAAIGGAAVAQSATTNSGQGENRHRVSHGVSGGLVRGDRVRGDVRGTAPHRGRHHDRRHDRHSPGLACAYGGIGYAEEFVRVDPYGTGFFAGGGGEVRMRGGRPVYDYDRSYPYQWNSGPAESAEVRGGESSSARLRCTLDRGVRVCRGGR